MPEPPSGRPGRFWGRRKAPRFFDIIVVAQVCQPAVHQSLGARRQSSGGPGRTPIPLCLCFSPPGIPEPQTRRVLVLFGTLWYCLSALSAELCCGAFAWFAWFAVQLLDMASNPAARFSKADRFRTGFGPISTSDRDPSSVAGLRRVDRSLGRSSPGSRLFLVALPHQHRFVIRVVGAIRS